MRKFHRDSENTQKRQYQPAGNVTTQTVPLLLLPVTLQSAAGMLWGQSHPWSLPTARHWQEVILCTLVNRYGEEADTGKPRSQLYLRESPSDLVRKGPLQVI